MACGIGLGLLAHRARGHLVRGAPPHGGRRGLVRERRRRGSRDGRGPRAASESEPEAPVRALLCPASLKGVLSARGAAAALARGFAACRCRGVELPDRRRRRGHGRCAPACARRRVARGDRLRPARTARARRAGSSFPTDVRSSRRPRRSVCRSSRSASAIRSSRRAAVSASSCSPRCASSRRRSRRRSRRQRDGRRRRGSARGPARAPGADDRALRRPDDARGRRSPLRAAEGRLARRRRDARAPARRDGRARARTPSSPGAGAAGGLGAAFAALGAELVPGAPAILDLIGFDEHVSSAATSSSPARVRSTERRPRARRPASSPTLCRRGGRSLRRLRRPRRRELDGVETVSLSGDRARAEADLEALGERLAA